MEDGPSMLSRPEATVVTLEHTLESEESRGSGARIIGQIENIGDSKGNCYAGSILQVNQEGSNDDMMVEDLSIGTSSVGDPIDLFNSDLYTTRVTSRTVPFTSMDEYETQMLMDLNSRSPADKAYYTVICFMLDHETANIDYLNIKDQIIELEPPLEIERISFVRVLLRYPIHPVFDIDMAIKDISEPASFSICYLEMSNDPPSEHSYDHIHPHQPSPRRAFVIDHHTTDAVGEQQMPAEILRTAISASGSHAVTVSRIGNRDIIDLWELQLAETISRVSYPYSCTPSSARSIVDLNSPAQNWFGLSLSWNGSQISIHNTRESYEEGILILEYHKEINQTQDQEQNISPSLQVSHRHNKCSLAKSFQGDATFTNLSSSQLDDDSERFVTCDMEGFSVYKTVDQWEMIYHIPQTRYFFDSRMPLGQDFLGAIAVGSILALKISDYRLSIWDLNTGMQRHLIDTQHKFQHHFLSSDGGTLAIVTTKNILLYSTETGDIFHLFDGSSYSWHGFIEGDKYIYGSHYLRGKRRFFIIDSRSTSRLKRYIAPPMDLDHAVRDIKLREKWDRSNTNSTVVLSFNTFILEVFFLDDLLTSVEDKSQCVLAGGSDLIAIPEIIPGEEIPYSGGTFVIQETGNEYQRTITMDIQFKDGKSRQYWWGADQCYFRKENPKLMMIQTYLSRLIFLSWKLPQSSQDELELLFCWIMWDANRLTGLSTHAYREYPVLSIDGCDIDLSPGVPGTLADPKSLQDGYQSLLDDEFQCDAAVDAAIKYLSTFINHYPILGNHSRSLIPSIINSQEYSRAELLLDKSLQANNWIPLRVYTRGANPVGIILEETKTDPSAYVIGCLLINYSLDKAKEYNDLTYILYLLECMDDLTTRYPDLALRITRRFSYIRCHDRGFVINNHRTAHPPTLSQLWRSNDSKIYESRNPILQFQLNTREEDPLNKNFTEDLFVAPINLLWSFVPNTRSPCKEFPLGYSSQRITLIQSLYHIILFNMNPFSHVYIRPRFYSLEILDNPAIDALVQYKWNTFAYTVWIVRFTAQCLYSLLILSAALMQVYHQQKGPLLGLFSAIVVLSCLFLWLEFLQWRESWHLVQSESEEMEEEEMNEEEEDHSSYSTRISRWISGILSSITGKVRKTPKMDPLGMKRSRSQYFRSPYNTLDLIVYAYPLVTSIRQITNTVNDNTSATTADFSFSVVFVFLNLLAELRVSSTVCKYITILFGIFSEIKVFSLVLATSTIFFTIAIIHTVHGRVGTPVNTDNSGNPGNSTFPDNPGLPDSFLGAISTVYLMMGGRFDPLNSDLYAEGEGDTGSVYKNAPLLVMVMVYFTFSSILMLNVLIALINNAFIKADDRWKQAWLENRLRYVEIAENMSYHIP
ncbi:hypothetical protein BGW38_009734, partial [Lunasporangiospora selenospora]